MEGQAVVLVVEDEHSLRELIEETVRQGGFEVLTAPNSLSAFEVLQSGTRVDALVTDINMPGAADGRELARFILNTGLPVKIIFLAGVPLDPFDPLGEHVRFLQKPGGVAELAKTLAGVLSAPTAQSHGVRRPFIEEFPKVMH